MHREIEQINSSYEALFAKSRFVSRNCSRRAVCSRLSSPCLVATGPKYLFSSIKSIYFLTPLNNQGNNYIRIFLVSNYTVYRFQKVNSSFNLRVIRKNRIYNFRMLLKAYFNYRQQSFGENLLNK